MSDISRDLENIESARYGKDARQSIHDGIEQCHNDVNNPNLTTEALQRAVQKKIDDHTIQNIGLENGSVTQDKLSPAFSAQLAAMEKQYSQISMVPKDGSVTTEKLADKAVTKEKTDFIAAAEEEEDFNSAGYQWIHDIYAWENGKPTGKTQTSGFYCTDLIPISAGKHTIFLTQNKQSLFYEIIYYGEDATYLGTAFNNSGNQLNDQNPKSNFNTPINIKSIRISCYISQAPLFKISHTNTIGNVLSPNISVYASSLLGKISADNTDFIQKGSDNILTYNENIAIKLNWGKWPSKDRNGNYILSGNGTQTGWCSSYLPVKGNTRYVRSKYSRNVTLDTDIGFFDSKKSFIDCMTLQKGNYYFYTPKNAAYMTYFMWGYDDGLDYIVEASKEKDIPDPLKNSGINILYNVTVKNGYWITQEGEVATGVKNDNITDFIEVQPSKKYLKKEASYIEYFDKDKNKIGNPIITKNSCSLMIDDNGSYFVNVQQFSFITPSNCKYIKTGVHGDNGKIEENMWLVKQDDYHYLHNYAKAYDYITLVNGKSNEPVENTEKQNNNLPTFNLNGDMTGMSHDKDCKMSYSFGKKNGWCTVKWQGNSSLSYPKKNFTLKFFHDPYYGRKDKVDMDLGVKASKFVLKANYTDHSQARNIVGARLWREIVKCRKTAVPDELKNSPRYGAIDGYPINLYYNGEYYGLYTLNIPKDDFTFGMDEDNPLHCAVSGETNGGEAEEFRATMGIGSWSNEVPEKWNNETQTALSNLIQFVRTSSDDDFKAHLNEYLDVESAIDYYVFCYFILASDSLGKNIILLTYDAKKWYMSMYDMDSTFGIFWNGSKFYDPKTRCPEDYQENNSLLWQRIEALFPQELYDRYKVLRESVLSLDHIDEVVDDFVSNISVGDYSADVSKWPNIPQANVDGGKQIKDFMKQRAPYVDGEFEAFNVAATTGDTTSETTTAE